MLAISRRRWISNASRLRYSTAANEVQKKSEPSAENVPGFYGTMKVEDNPVSSNDLLEAKRVGNDQKLRQTTVPPVTTSVDKFQAGLSPLQSSASITPTGAGLFQDAKLMNTPLSPGIPTQTAMTPPEEPLKNTEQIPSSGFSAFLRGISSRLPFFPSKKTPSSPINLATTREYHLPLTRPSLIRLIATDSQFLENSKDRLLFHQLCQGFDSAVVQRYAPVLNELKHLFNPLNPDNETLDNRRVSYRDRLDNEYWLLQKINDLLQRANFRELPREILIDKFLLHEDSNLNLHINGYDYDVLKFWILGREQVSNAKTKSWWRRSSSSSLNDYFKRVIVAIRLKGHDRLYLKAYRDIPLQNLTQLVPVGKFQLGNVDQRLIRLSIVLGASTAVTHLLTTMADYPIPGVVFTGTSLTVLAALWAGRNSYRSRINYLSNMNRIFFYKNIASNKQLLAMITDRAEDELSKEALLVYMFILAKQKRKVDLTVQNLELEIENWIQLNTNTPITFNSEQSIDFLRRLGILLPDDPNRSNCLQVVPFEQTVSILPQLSRTLSEKTEEWDLIEGYDRKQFEVDWQTILNEEKFLQTKRWN